MSNIANLKSYRKGQSGNPAGRPRGSRNVSTVLRAMLQEIAPKVIVEASFIKQISKGRSSATIADAVAARIIYQGIVKGDSWALRELLDRTEGKAKQTVEITSEETTNSIAESINSLIVHRKELNRDYGVPVHTKKEVEELVRWAAENYRKSADEIFAGMAKIDNPHV